MAKATKQFSRRKFLEASAALGVAISVPWLPGCGDEDSGAQPPGPPGRQLRNLHFDLSRFGADGPFVLHAIGSRLDNWRITSHTVATRAEFKSKSGLLQMVPDALLTHFVEDADLPTNAVQHIWVTAGAGRTASPVLSKIVCGGVDPADPHTWISPLDTAIALIFHHPEVVRLDPNQAAIVCRHIENSALLQFLADAIKPGWTVAAPATDSDGNPVLGSNGKQLVQYDPSDAVLREVDAVVKDVLARVFDDEKLENANWHLASGRTSESVADTSALETATSESFEADYPADPNNNSSAHGLYFTGLTLVDPVKRTVELQVKNFWLRYLTAHVEFFAPSGFAVKSEEGPQFGGTFDFHLSAIPAADGKLVKSRFLTLISANNDFFGIPVSPRDQAATPLRFDMPPAASLARVRFLTLGLGGENPFAAFGEENSVAQPGGENSVTQLGDALIVSSVITMVANIGVPAVLLAVAAGSDPAEVLTIRQVFTDWRVWAKILALVPPAIFRSSLLSDARPALTTIGEILVSLTVKSLPALREALYAAIGREEVEEAVPFVGWGIKLAALGAALAELGQTFGEVYSSPPFFENKIAVTLATKLTIKHDPTDPIGFPASATRWEVHANYDGKLGKTLKGTLPATRTDPISVSFRVPSGGTGKIDVWFLTDNNWIAGHGTTGDFANLEGADGTLTREITITENLVPLTAMTKYHHQRKLAVENGRYTWQAAKDAPPNQTEADLVCDADTLCELDAITLSEDAAVAGYAWQARSSTVPVCGGGPTSSPLHRIQNVSFTQRPEDGLKKAPCGYSGKPLMAYQLRTLQGQPGRYFYLDPTGAGGGHHLRAVSLDRSPFEQTAEMSWGKFSQQQNAMAIHPAGYVVGVNTQFHKLEILRLPQRAAPDAVVAASVLKAGKGTRIGLLGTPQAVGVDLLSGAIFVLEGGNRRIQALDVHGNPVKRFKGGSSAERRLDQEADVTYLDMAVESTGWIYLLSFAGAGRSPADYRLDIYDPNGMTDTYLSRTTGVAAGKMAVDLWRNIFTLNYEPIITPDGVEPSLSEWIPSTPDGCSQADNPFCQRI